MLKRMVIMLICTGVIFGGIFAYKVFSKKHMNANVMPPTSVSVITVTYSSWSSKLSATGNLRAINGVDVTTEVSGIVSKIVFKPGDSIQEGETIIELNADAEKAQLKSLEAQAELALITYNRDKEQFAVQGISKATLDLDAANLKSTNAQVAQQMALIAKKVIRAPFKGRLGISAVNLGQYLNPGDKIVTLQSLDPIYVDFYLPQQALPQIAVQRPVVLTTDTYPQVSFHGKVTSMNPKVDLATRNIEVEATLSNAENQLLPGMFGVVDITTSAPKPYLTVPQTAISYNPYGDLVYVLKEKEKDKNGNPVFIADQRFITVGETRGDQVQILKGVDEGELIVTAGQLKLKKGSLAVINNAVVLSNDPNSHPQNE